jgi:hypothetical protein
MVYSKGCTFKVTCIKYFIFSENYVKLRHYHIKVMKIPTTARSFLKQYYNPCFPSLSHHLSGLLYLLNSLEITFQCLQYYMNEIFQYSF